MKALFHEHLHSKEEVPAVFNLCGKERTQCKGDSRASRRAERGARAFGAERGILRACLCTWTCVCVRNGDMPRSIESASRTTTVAAHGLAQKAYGALRVGSGPLTEN
jgi:hypothetical protein